MQIRTKEELHASLSAAIPFGNQCQPMDNFLKHPLNMPHKLQDVYEAACYVLQDNEMVTQQSYHTLAKFLVAKPPVVSPTVPEVKTEMFASIMASFSKTIADAIQQGNHPHISGPTVSALRNTDCNFCRGLHFICDCLVVNDYVVAGKCRRNYEGKVVLSTAAFCPREIPGTLL